MTEQANSKHRNLTQQSYLPLSTRGGSADLISPVLSDLVMWGFDEQNSLGQRVLRKDIQARLDGSDDTEGQLNDLKWNPLYVPVPVPGLWEATVILVTYGQHLCEWDIRTVGALPHKFFQHTSPSNKTPGP